MSDRLKIAVWSRANSDVECFLCGAETEYAWGVPLFNGDVVSNDFPDHMWTNGGGCQAVCRACCEKHARGEIKVWDEVYIQPGFENGGGI